MVNPDNHLILVKGEDKTQSIISWRYDNYRPIIYITYHGGKEYPYHKEDVQFFKKPDIVDVRNKIVLKDGLQIFGVQKLQFFHNYFSEYCRICYDSKYFELVKYPDIKVIDSALEDAYSRNCFEYMKQIAFRIGLVVDGKNILAQHYEKIDFIREDSALAMFLKGSYAPQEKIAKFPIVYPFGFNLSQKQAVDNALSNPISIIEGPPGTGKTQTILNIIANAVMRGESVAVVSSNNSATGNVYEKLKKYGVDFIAAPLGNSSNKEVFIETQSVKLPNMSDWKKVDKDGLFTIQREVELLEESLRWQNELSIATAEKKALEKEYLHFCDYYNSLPNIKKKTIFPKYVSSSQRIKCIAEYEQIVNRKGLFSFFKEVFWRIKYGIKPQSRLGVPQETYIALCQMEYYKKRLEEAELKIKKISSRLFNVDVDARMKKCSELSMSIFRSCLATRYGNGYTRKVYTAEDLWRKSDSFIQDYPVVLSTTYSLRASLSNRIIYDYVIVDESSQVDLATGVLALSCAKKLVVVGDLKQLPNVIDNEQRKMTDLLFRQYELSDAYRYSKHSLLSSVVALFPDAPHVLLKEHYRCHPEIIGFCNQRFYNNELVVLTKASQEDKPLMVYRTVPGNHARGHINQRQIDVIVNEVFPQLGLNKYDGSVGIVTPYRNQANEIQRFFENTAVKADTADKFQGQERSVMIFSTVDNEIGDFASNPNRLNVAVSRAVDKFIVVTDGNENDLKSPIHELIGYIQYHNHEVVHSQIYSVFDYLYHHYAKARESVMRKYGKVSEVDSENLMYAVICDVLNNDEYAKYDVVMHVPLRMILCDLTKLNTRELSFATNHLTHVDFLIYSRITHKPILVVEVDGFVYHNNEKQKERDQVKNDILGKYNIPILRLSTIGSGEKEKVISALKGIESVC